MSDNQVITVPRDEVERLVKLLQYQAHPYPSPHAEFWQGLLNKPALAADVQRFWSYEAKNIRCVRESDYDALEQRLINAEAGLRWETERNALLLTELQDAEAQPQAEPVNLAAVAVVREHDHELRLEWLIEGGIAELEPGQILIVADQDVTDDEGGGELYRHPTEQPAPVSEG